MTTNINEDLHTHMTINCTPIQNNPISREWPETQGESTRSGPTSTEPLLGGDFRKKTIHGESPENQRDKRTQQAHTDCQHEIPPSPRHWASPPNNSDDLVVKGVMRTRVFPTNTIVLYLLLLEAAYPT
jgi:hypothetical protein